mgnify:CR=1 FL=1
MRGLAARFPHSRLFGRFDRTWAPVEQAADVDWVPGADSIIRNNIVLSAGNDGIAMQPHQSGSPSNMQVVHNTVINAGGDAMSLRGISGAVVIANNALYASGGQAFFANGTTGLTFEGNVGVGGGTVAMTEGDIDLDFVDASFSGAPPMDVFPTLNGALVPETTLAPTSSPFGAMM